MLKGQFNKFGFQGNTLYPMYFDVSDPYALTNLAEHAPDWISTQLSAVLLRQPRAMHGQSDRKEHLL